MLNRIVGGLLLFFALYVLPMNAQQNIIPGYSIILNAIPNLDSNRYLTQDADTSYPSVVVDHSGLAEFSDSSVIASNDSVRQQLLDSLTAILRISLGFPPLTDSTKAVNQGDTLGVQVVDTLVQLEVDSLSTMPIQQKDLRPKEPEISELHRFIRDYDIFKNRVYPAPAINLPEDTVLDFPKMSPLFMPLVFNARKRDFKLEWKNRSAHFVPDSWLENLQLGQSVGVPYVKRLARQILLSFEAEKIDKIRYRESDLPEPEILEVPLEANSVIQWTSPIRIRPKNVESLPSIPVRYTHWNLKGRATNQLTQTYVSPNWSSGGLSNMSTLSAFYWVAKYDNKQGIQFDNFIDIKLGFNTESNDSLRKVNINNDQFQASSKLGIKAIKNFYYSASVDFSTQFLTNYKTNTYDKKAAFLSPAKLYIGIGMDYKIKNKEKGYSFSALLTPFTYSLNYLRNIEDFNPKAFGIEEGKHFGQGMGFKLATSIDMKITEFISWNSYFYFYSDFNYIDSEWKNTINFNVNHYLSTQLFIHMKMNTKNERPEGERLIQFKEFLSFGLVYYW